MISDATRYKLEEKNIDGVNHYCIVDTHDPQWENAKKLGGFDASEFTNTNKRQMEIMVKLMNMCAIERNRPRWNEVRKEIAKRGSEGHRLGGKFVERELYKLCFNDTEGTYAEFEMTAAETKAYKDACENDDLGLQCDLIEEFCIARGWGADSGNAEVLDVRWADRFESFLHEAKLEAATQQSD